MQREVAERRSPRTSATVDQLLERYLEQFAGSENTLELYRGRSGSSREPTGEDGGSFWRKRDVFEWAARQGQPLAGWVPLELWPAAREPAEFLGAVRIPRR